MNRNGKKNKNYAELIKEFIKNNKKASICTMIIILVVLATVVTTVTAGAVKKKKLSKRQEDTSVVVDITTGTTNEETETTEETEEETEAEVVEDYVVEEFFENEISTEDQEALELPSRRLNVENRPYDGARRYISYFGDSMVAGVGCGSVNASVNGMNITGWTSPRTISYLTGIETYNFGVPGETSYEIAYRAGGVKLHTDRSVTISEDVSAIVRLIDEDGDVFTFNDYSGYGVESNSYPDTMYINGYLCKVMNTGYNEVSIQLVKGYAAYSMDSMADTGVRYIQAQQYADSNVKPVNNDITETPSGVKSTENTTTGNKPSENITEASTESSTQAPTEATTQKPTEPSTQKPTEPSTSPAIGLVDIPEGSLAEPKAAKDHSQKDILILEIGSNGGWGSDYQTLILQYDNIIINSGCDYYIIVGDTDDPGTSIGDDNQGEYNEDGSYVGIGDTSWEAALREAYGAHFFNTRTYIIQYGLDVCGLNTTTEDLENFKRGNISKQLRYDWTHFNAYGYYAKGMGIYEKGKELGYWS